MAADLGALVLTIVTGVIELGIPRIIEMPKRLASCVAAAMPIVAAAWVAPTLQSLNTMFGVNRSIIVKVAHAFAVPRFGIAVDVDYKWWHRTSTKNLAKVRGKIFGLHLCDWLENVGQMFPDWRTLGARPAPSATYIKHRKIR
jgi:hypothetical protein